MGKEVDIHSLPDSHNTQGRYKNITKQCQDCPFHYTVVNRDWASGHKPIGEVCVWNTNWEWIQKSNSKTQDCRLFTKNAPEFSASKRINEQTFIPYGIRLKDFTPEVFRIVTDLYSKTAGGDSMEEGEVQFYHQKMVDDLKITNAAQLRLGSFISDNSKLEIEWRYLSQSASEQVLTFYCYPNCSWRPDQGEYLSSRFEMAVIDYFQKNNIAIAINR